MGLNVKKELKFYIFRFDIECQHDDTREIIVQLSQRDARSLLMERKDHYVIGFCILKVEENRKYRMHSLNPQQVIAKSDYIKSKHIFLRTSLSNGRYVLIPTTFQPGQTTDYLLRLFCEKDTDLRYLTKDVPTMKWYKFWQSAPILLTRITVQSASRLEKQDIFGSK